jgi:hypothetical protein
MSNLNITPALQKIGDELKRGQKTKLKKAG